MVGVDVGSGGIHHRCCIGLARRLGGNVDIFFRMPSQTEGEAYYMHSVGYRGGGENGKLVQIARKCDA